jgi:putative endonuclease
MARHNILGKLGEDAAYSYLVSKGYAIVDRNVHIGQHLEIDILAMYGTRLVCIEVKTRTDDSGLTGIESMTKRKKQLLIMAANSYVKSHKMLNEVQFDVVLVTANHNGEITQIEHIPDAFYPPVY